MDEMVPLVILVVCASAAQLARQDVTLSVTGKGGNGGQACPQCART